MTFLTGIYRSARAALRPGPSPWRTAMALRAVAAAALIAVVGAVVGDLSAVGVAYLGAACSVAFVTHDSYRLRALALLAQACGAAIGIVVGVVLPHSAISLVATAAVAGAVSGLAGAVGPNAPGFGMMLSIGVAFGQFGVSTLPWWLQAVWYLTGTAVVAVATLTPWLYRRGAPERALAANVVAAAADLCEATGTDAARTARDRLAAASAAARLVTDHVRAQAVSYAAAILYAQDRPVPAVAVTALRTAARQLRDGVPVDVAIEFDTADPGLRALADALAGEPRPGVATSVGRRLGAALRAATGPTALANAARIALCLGAATAIAVAAREPTHAYWLPLTVAVIVRPEYASVFVRTVNRVVGTVVGATVAAAVLTVAPSGLPVAVAAALALGFAVLAAPKLYGLSVIGVTASALLSSSIGAADSVLPGLRLLDTAAGAVVAVVLGYLVWPDARRLPAAARLDAAVPAVRAYLAEAVKPPPERVRWHAVRDDAYRLAHQVRAACVAATREPPPVSSLAFEVIPAAAELEDLVDYVTALAANVDAGGSSDASEALASRLTSLGGAIPTSAQRWHDQS